MTQNDIILEHMKQEGSITSAEAMNRYGIARLASRINDLKKKGYEITTTLVITKTRLGRKCRYARYTLEPKE